MHNVKENSSMHNVEIKPDDRILVIGATGFIGGRLVPELLEKGIKLRLLVHNPSKLSPSLLKNELIEVVKGDILKDEGLPEAFHAIHSAYYMVHSMGGKSIFSNREFAKMDKLAAKNFIAAADAAGLNRVIYLGGLGEMGENLSEHLKTASVTMSPSQEKNFPEAIRIAIEEEKEEKGTTKS